MRRRTRSCRFLGGVVGASEIATPSARNGAEAHSRFLGYSSVAYYKVKKFYP